MDGSRSGPNRLSFNGATLFQAWRVHLHAKSVFSSPTRFNGATLFQAWREGCSPMEEGRRQGFNGATLFQAWRERLLHRLVLQVFYITLARGAYTELVFVVRLNRIEREADCFFHNILHFCERERRRVVDAPPRLSRKSCNPQNSIVKVQNSKVTLDFAGQTITAPCSVGL